jgi:PKD repeat protein
MYTLWWYPALTPKTDPDYVETGGVGTGIYSGTQNYLAYPDNTLNCTWDISVYPYIQGVAPQPILSVTNNQVFITIPNYKKDNGTPVPGTGDLGLNPPVDDPSTLFCVGENIVGFIFTDATVFDCQLAAEPDLPNTRTRNAQFVYGTQTGAAIPNVFIDVFGTPVQITDAAGNPMPNSWTVDPSTGGAVAAYSTPSGFFEGPVTQYLWDASTKTLITPLIQTYPINHTGDFINDQENDIFDVTLRNWGPCNPYDAMDPFTHLQAVTEFSRLRLVLSPPLPTAPDVTICLGASTVLTAVRNGTNPGVLHWYNNANLLPINEVGTGTTYNPGALAVGVYNYWVREIGTSGQLCEGPAKQVVLTINPIPNKPGITVTGSATFCFNGVTSVTLTANPNTPPAVATYQWYKDAVALNTLVANTFNQVNQTGSYTLQVFGVAPTSCPSPLSDPVAVAISNPATVNAGVDQTICSSSTVSLTGTRGGSATSSTWTTSGTGTFANASSLNTTYTPSAADIAATTVTLTLTTNNPAGPCPAVNDAMVVTINPDATAGAGVDQMVCSSSPDVTLTGTRGGAATSSTWTTSGTGIFANASLVNTTYIPSAADIAAGTVTLTITTNDPAGPCPAASDAMVATISPAATVGAGVDQTICSSSTVSLTGTRGGGATSSTWTTSGTGTFANASNLNTTYTPSAADIAGVTVTLTLTTNDPAGPCNAVSDFMVVTINMAATVNAGVDQGICALANATLAGSRGGGATTSSWSGGTGSYVPDNTALNAVYSPSAAERLTGFVTLTLTTNDPTGPCLAVSDNVTITIGSSPISATLTGSGNACSGASSSIKSVITGGATPYIVNYTRNGVAQPALNPYTSGTDYPLGVLAVGTYNYQITSVTDFCGTPVPAGGLPGIYTIIINPIPSAAATTNNTPSICNNGTTDIVLHADVVNTDFLWTVSNAPAVTWQIGKDPVAGTRIAGEGTSIAQNLAHNGTAPVTVTYTITPRGPGATACLGTPVTRDVIVYPTPVLSTSLTPPAICSNTAFSYAPASATAGTTFNWTRATVAGITPVGPTAGANNPNETLVNTTANPIVVTYVYTLTANGCNNIQNVTVTVNPSATLTSSLTPAAICSNTSFSYSPTSATVGTTFNWNRATVAGITPAGPTSGTNNPNETLVNTTANAINVTYSYTLTANGCSNVQNVVVSVKPTPVLSTTLTPSAICSNTAFSYNPASLTAGTTFNWSRATVAGITPAGPTSGTDNPNETLVNTTANPIVVTYSYTLVAVGCSNVQSVTVTVNPSPALTSSLAPPAICSNTAFSYTPTSATGGTTFNWSRATVAGITPAGPTSGTNNPNETLVNTTTNAISVTYAYTLTANGCSNVQNVVVSVKPTPVLSTTLTPPAICSNTAFSYVPASLTAGTTFNWSRATVAGITPVGPTSGTNNPNETLINTTASPIVVTYAYTLAATGCSNVQNVTVTVNPSSTLSSSLTPPAICSNTAFSYTPTSATAGTTFNWSRASIAGITPAGPTSGTNNPNETLVNTTPNAINVTYAYTLAANGCNNVQNVVVSVKPTPVLSTTLTPPAICSNTAFSYVPASLTAGTTFNWSRATVAGITPVGPTSGTNNPNETLVNTTTNPIVVTYIYTLAAAGCSNNQSVTVTVNPSATLTSTLTPPAICSNTLFSYVPTSATAGTVFNWSRASIVGITPFGPTSGSNNPNETLVNSTPSAINVTYAYTLSANGCNNIQNVVVAIKPTPTLSTTLTPADICSNTSFSYAPASLTAGTTFNWSRATIAGITPAGPTAGANNPNETLRNLTSSSIAVTYQYTLIAALCSNIQNVVVNIKPEPVISDQAASVCSGNSLNHKILLDNFTNPADNVLFTWPVPTNDPGLTGGTARGVASSANMNDVFINASGSALSSTYIISPFYNGCSGSNKTIIVTIGSEPVLDPGLNRNACSNVETLLELKEAPLSVVPTDYNITQITISGGLVANVGNTTVPASNVAFDYLKNHKFTNETGVDKTVIYRVVPLFGVTCIGAAVDVVVTIKPQPVILPGQTGIACSNVPVNKEILLVPANTPAGSIFNWNAPVMSNGSIQGSAGVNVAADPINKNHITDVLVNLSLVPITATYTISPKSSFGCDGTSRDVVITVNPEPAVSIVSGRDKLCRGETNIVYSVPAVGGSSYSWTVPASVGTKTFDFNTNAIIINAAAVGGSGNISVIETNSFSCPGPATSFPVQVYDPPAISVITGDNDVCALSTSTYSVPVNAGSVYAWILPAGASLIGDPTANTINVTFSTFSGNLSVKETNAAGCVTNHTPLLVTVTALPTATISNGGTICMEGTRPLNIAFTGNGPWTFVHAINGTDQVFVNAPASPHTLTVNTQGTYTITSVTDSKACVNTGTGNATVSYFPKPTGTISGTTAICNGNSATITISLTGQAPYNFTYTDGVTPVNITNHPAGTYTFTVNPLVTTTYTLTALTDNNSCSGLLSGSAVVTVNNLPVLTLVGTNLLCKGDNTGSIALTSVGNSPFSFAWTGPDAYISGSEDISGLKAGIYNVSVTDVNTCSSTASLTITEPTQLLLANSGNINLLCNAATDGAGSFTASGGTAPYTFFTVSNTTGGSVNAPLATSISFTNAGVGAITMRVTDANGCQVVSTISILQPTALNLSAILSTSIEGSHNINCNGANTGTIGLSVSGGVSPYTYSWTTVGGSGLVAGAGNQNALTAGAYTAIITDANACTITGNYTLTQPVALAVTATTDDNIIGTCPASVANLNATITGGVPLGGGGYTYSWSPASGLSAANILNPVAKPAATTTYTLTVTDANGCSKTSSVLIAVNPALTAVATASDNLIGTCPASFANLDVTVTGGEDFGAGVYLYSWAPVTGLSNTTIRNPIAKPAITTTYAVSITDKNGCTTVSTIKVSVAPVLTATATTDDALIGTCPISDAQLNLTVTGGEAAYTYLWDNAATLSNATIVNPVAKPLVTTTYTATVTDANACTTTAPILVNVTPALTAIATASDLIIGTCPTSVSNLDVAVAGGEAAYSYKWLPSVGLDDSNIKNPVAKPAITTTYTVTVTDANACTTTSSITITVQPALDVSSTASDYIISTCPTSVANISSIVTGGETGYTYSWSPAAGLSAINIPNPVAKPAATTTYTLTVTDANGCSASGNITITVQPVLSATASASDLIISTCPTSTSTLNSVVTGGEPGYTYSWLPIAGLSDPAIQNPVAKPAATTTYTLTATDVNGCSTAASITITVQPVLAATATSDDYIIGTCPSSLANLDVTVTGGEAGYTYNWAPVLGLNNPFVKTPIAKPAVTTIYTVTVTDANGCSTTSPVTITVNPVLTVTTSTSDTHIGTCPTSVANLTAVAAGGEAAYSYSWLPVTGLSDASISNPVAKPTVTTTYMVTVTDANGCTATSNITITVQPDLSATAIASDYNIGTCPTSTSTLDVNVTGGESAYSYSWAPAASLSNATIKTPVAKPAITTTYTVTVTDNNGCTTTAPVTVNVLPALTLVASATDIIIGTCPTSTSNLDATVAGGEAGYTYSWLPVTGLSDATLKNPIAKPAATTAYTVTVTDVNGCTATSTITITVAPAVTVITSASDLLISTCPTSVSNLLATPAGGEMPVGGYLYSWSPSTGLSATNIANPVAKPNSTTTYTVTITDQNNCTAVSSITVNVAPALSAVATASDPLIGTCPGSTSNLDVVVTGGESPYSYSWAPAASLTNAAINNPVAKPAATTTYTVTVTDINGCTTTANVTVNVAPVLAALATASDSLISTCPTSVSQLNSTVSGGEAGYTYLWNNAASLSDANIANPVAKPLVTTTYTVTITDVNGCTTTASIKVNVAPALNAIITASDLILSTCPTSVSNLDVITTGGEQFPSGGYTHSWTPVIGLNYTNVKNPVAKPAATTTYTVTVTDFNGCSTTAQVTIVVSPPLALTFTTLKFTGGFDISCFGASDGQIDLTVAGGEAPFTYSWTGPSSYTSVSEDNTALKSGTYNVTVTDANGCTVSTSVILVEPVVVGLSKSADVVLPCFGDASATGSFTVSGGNGPYTFTVVDNTALATVISSSPTSQTFSGGAAGRVVMRVVDANGCNDQDTIFITQPALLLPGSVNGTQEVCFLGDPITLNEVTPPSAGPGLYLYQWESASALAGPYGNIAGANLSSYNPPLGITVTTHFRRRVNSGTCAVVYSNVVTVTVNPLPVAVITGDATICPSTSTPLKVNVTTGTSPYTVVINNGVPSVPGYISNANINVSPSVYTEYSLVSVTDAKSCVSTAPSANLTGLVKISMQPDAVINTQPSNAITCEGSNTTFTTNATGVGISYKWQIENTPGVFVNVNDLAGVYSGSATATLTVINPLSTLNGKNYRAVITDLCSRKTNTAQASLTVNEKPEITLQPVSLIVCEGSNISFTINAGLTTSPTYQWQEFNGTIWADILTGGNYLGANSNVLNVFNVSAAMNAHQFRVNVSGTCTPVVTSLAASLTVNTAPQITYNPHDTIVCENLPAKFQVLATGTSLDFQWQVDMNDGNGFRNLADTLTLYSGTTSSTLNVLKPSRRFNGYKYRAQVTGTCNPTKTTSFAVLSVNTAPEMAVQPVAQTICEFNNVSFSVNISGANINYIWQENSGGVFKDLMDTASYIGTGTNTLNIFNVSRSMSSNRYRVIATGLCNPSIVSNEASLTVKTSPVITLNPTDIAICENTDAIFTTTSEGSDLVYQWQVSTGGSFSNIINDTTYSGVNTASLTIKDAEAVYNGYKYRLRVSGSCVPPANSSEAILMVDANPIITAHPSAATICEDGNVSFISGAIGPNLSYQWNVSSNNGTTWSNLTDDANYSGSTTPTLTVLNAPVTFNNNLYQLSVSMSCIGVKSNSAKLTVNPNPLVNITGTGLFPIVCGGTPMTLNGNPSGGSGTYITHSWTGDTAPLNSFNTAQTEFKTIINGSYNLTYSVTDSKNCKASEIVTIINDMPNAQYTSDAVPACGFLTVNFTNTSTRAVSYEWNFDDGTPVETTLNATHGFDNMDPSGLVKYYKVELTAISANGCEALTNQYITIYPKVDPTFSVTPTSACQPVVATLITQPGAANYEWDFGDGQQVTGGYTVLHEFVNFTNANKIYTITLTTTSFYGCKATVTNTIEVFPLPTPNFSVAPIIQTFPDATINITSLVTPGPWVFEYDFGDGDTSSLENPVHTYLLAGTYNIVQRVSTGICSDSIAQSVIINPTPPIAAFTQPVSGCTPLEIQFENNSQYQTTNRWDFGDGSISTKENPVYTYYNAGTFPISLTVTGPGGSSTFKTTLEVYASPILNFSNYPDSVYVNDKPVKFYNLSGYTINYSWNFGDYDEDTNAEQEDNASIEFEPAHIYHSKGWKDVQLIGWNDHCRDTIVKKDAVFVSPAGKFIFPNVFRPDPSGPIDGKWDKNDPATVNKIFYPGVVESVLEYHLYIYNRWGEQIFKTDDITIGWNGYINGELAKQGVYVWKVSGKYTNGKNFSEAGDVTLLY